MPYINTKTNLEITKETAEKIKTRLGKAISLFPGKSESWLMTSMEGGVPMYFQGEDKPVVFADVQIFGTPGRTGCEAFAEEMTAAFCEILEVSPDCVYIKFSGAENWSWNGRLF